VAEAWYDHRGSVRQRVYGQLSGTVSVLTIPTDNESRSLDAPKVFGVVGGIGPALELEREHLGGCRRKVVYQPAWGRGDSTDADDRGYTLTMASGDPVNEARAIRVADHRGSIDAGRVHYGDDVGDVLVETVCHQAHGLVAASMASVVVEQMTSARQRV
jgi:hypothetical protein